MKNPFLKNTFRFMGMFVLVTLLSLGLLVAAFAFIPTGSPLYHYIPLESTVEPEAMDWEKIKKIGGEGMVIDRDGNVVKTYNGKSPGKLKVGELGKMFRFRGNEKSAVAYDTPEGDTFLLLYPSDKVSHSVTMDVNEVMGAESYRFLIVLVLILAVYFGLVYLIIRRLSKDLRRETDRLREEEDERKDLFFRGLAHDVKTPLAGIIAYSAALYDGIVPEDSEEDYLEGIRRNALLLKDRVNDMTELTTLNEGGIYRPKKGDLLEEIRRYVGENYSRFLERGGDIRLEFDDTLKFETEYDKKLFERVLENILENSVNHNDPGVIVIIDFDPRERVLFIRDTGKGVPEEIRDKLFEPMVTGDASRTGEKLRGMGLANVKRIVKLHGWEITYDDGFRIKMS